jgi:tRNA(Ile)-lysidine synthase
MTLLLSGGGDSVALFHLLRLHRIEFSVLHFQHDGDLGFARESRDFCRKLCAEQQVPFEVLPVAGRELAESGDLSWEAACRKLRYEQIQRRAGTFLTGHTMDDQAETVIMRLLDGSGLAGLAGIKEKRGDGVLRPLLRFRREQLRQFLKDREWDWLDDPSNEDGNDRAKIRTQILPYLSQDRPHLAATLARTARRLGQDEAYLQECVTRWMRKTTSQEGDSWPHQQVKELSRALQVRFLKRVWASFGPGRHRPRATLFEECFRIIERGTNNAWVDFPGGWSVGILGDRIWAKPKLPDSSWEISPFQAETHAAEFLELSRDSGSGWIGWNVPHGSVLRGRRPGDRYGGKCLKKILANTGQPPWVRDRWPLLVRDQRVLAVWGLGAEASVTERPTLWLQFLPSMLRGSVWPKLGKRAEE